MLLAHLSDPHLDAGALAAGPAQALHTALGRILGLVPTPDAVVITGDLVEHGDPAQYAVLRELLSDVPLPVYLVAGNHDDSHALRATFAGGPHLAGGDSTHYAVDLPDARLLVLDSAVPGSGAGQLGAEQLAWLEAELTAHPSTPALVALHHPPTRVGIPFLDTMGLKDADALAGVIQCHPQVVRVLAGHVHRSITAAFAGTVAMTAPSTWRQSALDMSSPGRMGYLDEPAWVLLHQLDGLTGGLCLTHALPVQGGAPIFAIPR